MLSDAEQACKGKLGRLAQVGFVEPFVVATKGIPEQRIGARLTAGRKGAEWRVEVKGGMQL
jgi:hypothetical protein